MKKKSESYFVFLRHGESTGNAENRHQGQADYPLTELGKKQAHLLAKHWEQGTVQFDRLIVSPLSRAEETSRILNKVLQSEITIDPIWMERDNGKLAGLLHKQAREIQPPSNFIPLFQPIADTGESQWELYLRAGTALNTLMKYPPGKYLVISHGGLLNMVLLALIGLVPQANFQGPGFYFSNTGFTSVLYTAEKNQWLVLEHNNTNHLLKQNR